MELQKRDYTKKTHQPKDVLLDIKLKYETSLDQVKNFPDQPNEHQ